MTPLHPSSILLHNQLYASTVGSPFKTYHEYTHSSFPSLSLSSSRPLTSLPTLQYPSNLSLNLHFCPPYLIQPCSHLTHRSQHSPYHTNLSMSLHYLRQFKILTNLPMLSGPCLILPLLFCWLDCSITLSFFLFLEQPSKFTLRVFLLAIPSGWNALFQIFLCCFFIIKSQLNCQLSPIQPQRFSLTIPSKLIHNQSLSHHLVMFSSYYLLLPETTFSISLATHLFSIFSQNVSSRAQEPYQSYLPFITLCLEKYLVHNK